MTDRDYLWCVLNLMLDDEEVLERLCPTCRKEAEERRCPVCGVRREDAHGGENAGFDMTRFLRMSRGDTP